MTANEVDASGAAILALAVIVAGMLFCELRGCVTPEPDPLPALTRCLWNR